MPKFCTSCQLADNSDNYVCSNPSCRNYPHPSNRPAPPSLLLQHPAYSIAPRRVREDMRLLPKDADSRSSHCYNERQTLPPGYVETPLGYQGGGMPGGFPGQYGINKARNLLANDTNVLVRKLDEMTSRCDCAHAIQMVLSGCCIAFAGLQMSVPAILGYYGVAAAANGGDISKPLSPGLKVIAILNAVLSWVTSTTFSSAASIEITKKLKIANTLAHCCCHCLESPAHDKSPEEFKKCCNESCLSTTAMLACWTPAILLSAGTCIKATYDAFNSFHVNWATYLSIPIQGIGVFMTWISAYKFHLDMKRHYWAKGAQLFMCCCKVQLENYKLQTMVNDLLLSCGEQRGEFTHRQVITHARQYDRALGRVARLKGLLALVRQDLLKRTGVDLFDIEKKKRCQCPEEGWLTLRKCFVTAGLVIGLYYGVVGTAAAYNLGPLASELFGYGNGEKYFFGPLLAITSYSSNVPIFIAAGTKLGDSIATHIEGLGCCGENRSRYYQSLTSSDWIVKAIGAFMSVSYAGSQVGLGAFNPLFNIKGSSLPYCFSILPGALAFGYMACHGNFLKLTNMIKDRCLAPKAKKVLLERQMDTMLDKAVDTFCGTCCCSREEVKNFETTASIIRIFMKQAGEDLTMAADRHELTRILADLRTKNTSPPSSVIFEDLPNDGPQPSLGHHTRSGTGGREVPGAVE